MDGISGRIGVGNLDIAAGLEMLEGLSVDSAPVRKASESPGEVGQLVNSRGIQTREKLDLSTS
jgi:hypothetical protein